MNPLRLPLASAKDRLRQVIPRTLWNFLKSFSDPVRLAFWKVRHTLTGSNLRRPVVRETSKARERREREGFFAAYCTGRGLDIGYGGDLLAPNCDPWDVEHGDAQTLSGVADAQYDFVYSSHTLEHLPDQTIALRSWWRVLRPGGYLLLYLPHRDLFEKKQTLPSRWSAEHKRYYLPDRDDPPDTYGIGPLLGTLFPEGTLVSVRECSAGHTVRDPRSHSDGEYSIEVVVQKV